MKNSIFDFFFLGGGIKYEIVKTWVSIALAVPEVKGEFPFLSLLKWKKIFKNDDFL